MKKLFVLFSLFCFAGCANAYVDTQYMTQEPFLVNVGYSSEMANLISITAQDPNRKPAEDDKYAPKIILRKAYNYIVPGQSTDLDFYNHSGSFNGWSWRDY
ncbi:hypothetical protein II906_09395 [bacterium]|nr:hypothetical protein [bacterium]